jgi:hypothetical protein
MSYYVDYIFKNHSKLAKSAGLPLTTGCEVRQSAEPFATDHIASGCPDNVEAFMASVGWTVMQRTSWRATALAYGWTPEPSRFAADVAVAPGEGGERSGNGSGSGGGPLAPEHEVQFLVAVRTF